MPEPVRYFHCICGGTAFRVPLEHKSSDFVIECTSCGNEIALPAQGTPADVYFPCPLRGD